jgi:hypothetical protein
VLGIQHFHIFAFNLHRFTYKAGRGVHSGSLGQVHDPKNVVDRQTQDHLAARAPPSEDHRRMAASTRHATFNQHVKVEDRHRITAILGKTEEAGT